MPGRAAAVLVPLIPDGESFNVVLTRRRDDLRRHPGEIAFPGGRRDDGDTDLIATALREAREETGLDPHGVTLAGALDPLPTIATGYAIYPFVGVIERPSEWAPQEREVDAILEFPIDELAAAYELRKMRRRGISFTTNAFPMSDQWFIWGATGRLLVDLMDRVGIERPS